LARKLDGQGVFVTGTRVGDVIHVSGMKADEGAYRETRSVEIRGELSRDILLYRHGPLDKRPVTVWYVAVNGTKYRLDFRVNRVPQGDLDKLEHRTVVVTGTLRDDVVTVDGLRAAG